MRAHAYKRGDMGITIMVSLDVVITVLANGHIYADDRLAEGCLS